MEYQPSSLSTEEPVPNIFLPQMIEGRKQYTLCPNPRDLPPFPPSSSFSKYYELYMYLTILHYGLSNSNKEDLSYWCQDPSRW